MADEELSFSGVLQVREGEFLRYGEVRWREGVKVSDVILFIIKFYFFFGFFCFFFFGDGINLFILFKFLYLNYLGSKALLIIGVKNGFLIFCWDTL